MLDVWMFLVSSRFLNDCKRSCAYPDDAVVQWLGSEASDASKTSSAGILFALQCIDVHSTSTSHDPEGFLAYGFPPILRETLPGTAPVLLGTLEIAETLVFLQTTTCFWLSYGWLGSSIASLP